MKYLVAGQPKSGTTALFYRIKKSLRNEPTCFFEPKRWEEPTTSGGNVLTKILLLPTTDIASFDTFDKKILIVRDPRDRLISVLLYSTIHTTFLFDEGRMREWIEAIKDKERDPRSKSVLDLFQLKCRLQTGRKDHLVELLRNELRYSVFAKEHPTYFVLRYDDLVEGRLAELGDFLGLTFTGDETVDARHQRVVRTKSSGSWRSWLSDEDVSFFKPMFTPYMAAYAFDDDWRLDEHPEIRPEHASDYVERIVAEWRQKERPGAKPSGAQSHRVEQLIHKARDEGKKAYEAGAVAIELGASLFGVRTNRILIAGQPKTGTTALFFKVKAAMPPNTVELFEPKEPFHATLLPRPVLAKILVQRTEEAYYSSFSSFDHKILITRDPRDQLISALLYSTIHSRFFSDDEKLARFLELLRKKESDPRAVSVLEIYRFRSELQGEPRVVPDHIARAHAFASGFEDRHPGYFVVKYEDMVSDNLGALERELGMTLGGEAEVGEKYQKVVRTKAAGGWRSWFTDEDVTYFQPVFERYMSRYGYAGWDLAGAPPIRPEHASEYVARIVAERRQKLALGPAQESESLLGRATAALRAAIKLT
ncbi:MAG: sulfotransferase domain-containing protein [Deltaproteobacteria bacterium]|nr:sulfotransferase domain-containing protein [Deltaproteobacteria bacterium]